MVIILLPFHSPGVRSSLDVFRPSCPCELCPQEKTSPFLVRNKVCWSPQQTLVITPGTVQDTGLRAVGGPNCPLELSPQQYSCTMSLAGPEHHQPLFILTGAAFKCNRSFHNPDITCSFRVLWRICNISM